MVGLVVSYNPYELFLWIHKSQHYTKYFLYTYFLTSTIILLIKGSYPQTKLRLKDFPGGSVIKNPPANAEEN